MAKRNAITPSTEFNEPEDFSEFAPEPTIPPEAKVDLTKGPPPDDGDTDDAFGDDVEEISFDDVRGAEPNGYDFEDDAPGDITDQENAEAIAAMREDVIGPDVIPFAPIDDFQIDSEPNEPEQMPGKASKQSLRAEHVSKGEGVSLDDFYAYMVGGGFIFIPTREIWPATSVNARVPPIMGSDGEPIPAATWLKQNRPVEQMTWAPGLPLLISDRLIALGGWIKRLGVTCFNLYLPPTIAPGDPDKADPWLDHVRKVYRDDAAHIIKWLAHRVQFPAVKINHALVLGGAQGIGKDTICEPVKRAIGPWNFQEASPQQILGSFNGYLKSVILRVNEARDLGEFDRFAFYDHLKAYTAAPPDTLRVNEKHIKEHYIPNCTNLIITTNHKQDGIFLPADDRRHYVAWSDLTKEDFQQSYWDAIWRFYDTGGDRHVAAYLAALDLSRFNAKQPPPKTQAFWEIVNSNRAPEDAELADVLERLDSPPVTTIARIAYEAETQNGEFAVWLRERKNRRIIPHRLEKCDYTPVRNDDAKDGLWKINGARQVIYARKDLSLRDRIEAARDLLR